MRSMIPHAMTVAGGLLTSLAVLACAGTGQDAAACWVQQGTLADAAQRPSPLDSASVALGDGEVKICYGAPAARGRQIMGGLVPYDRPWRAGADEATSLRLTVPAEVVGVRVEPGAYSLYVVPGQDSWQVVLNETVERWGIPISAQVTEADIGSGTAQVESTEEMVERLRYRFEDAGEGGVDLLLEWERTRVRIPIRAVEA